MTRSDRRKLVFGGLIVGLASWYGLSPWLDNPVPARAQAASVDTADPNDSEELFTWALVEPSTPVRQQPGDVTGEWPDNPFFGAQPASSQREADTSSASPAEAARFVLNAILSSAEPLAMINGQVYAVGDRLADGSEIVAIGTSSVTLHGPHGKWTLELSE
jgi:hypothetical protein